MQRGSIKSVRLSERVTSGRDQWLQWHTEFARNFPKYVQASNLPQSWHLNNKTLQNLLWHTEFARNFPKYVQASSPPRSRLLNDVAAGYLDPLSPVCFKD